MPSKHDSDIAASMVAITIIGSILKWANVIDLPWAAITLPIWLPTAIFFICYYVIVALDKIKNSNSGE